MGGPQSDALGNGAGDLHLLDGDVGLGLVLFGLRDRPPTHVVDDGSADGQDREGDDAAKNHRPSGHPAPAGGDGSAAQPGQRGVGRDPPR